MLVNMKPESKAILSMMDGYKKSFILAAATKLNLFEKISHSFSDISTLTTDPKISPESIQRLLRVLDSMGLVKVEENKVKLTQLGISIQNDHHLRDYLLISSFNWIEEWSNLFSILTNGKQSDGSSWTSRAKDPKVDLAFHHFMVDSQSHSPWIPITINQINQKKIVDVGGGLGITLASILNSAPNAYGLLFDLPHVIEHAKHHLLSSKPFEGRCEFISGSFLDTVPVGGDLYLLNNILHDWNDEYAKKILNNCYQAMKHGARLVITETFIPENGNNEYASMTDIHLMVVHGGRKRTRMEYEAMLSEIGFNMRSQLIDSIEVEK